MRRKSIATAPGSSAKAAFVRKLNWDTTETQSGHSCDTTASQRKQPSSFLGFIRKRLKKGSKKGLPLSRQALDIVAERAGFEPAGQLPVRQFSKLVL